MVELFEKKHIETIKNVLLERKETISIAESVTGGLLQFALSMSDDAIKFFQGGITAYNIGQKARHLHIDLLRHCHATACLRK